METIILAALDLEDHNCIITCRRHCDAIHCLAKNGFKTPIMFEEGFITSTGRFVDRVEAKRIAIESGQITESEFRQLYSEDLW